MPQESRRPRLRADVGFRPDDEGWTELVAADGATIARLGRDDAAIASMLDGSVGVDALARVASALGLPGSRSVDHLLDRLERAGCLDATARSDDARPRDDDLRRALILATRGLDAPARRLLQDLDAAAPGRPEVRDILALLDAERELAGDDREALGTALAVAPAGLPAPSPGFAQATPHRPARVGYTARARLIKLGVLAALVTVMALIPVRRTVHAPVRLRPLHLATVRTPVAAVLLVVQGADGQVVERGQVVAQLDDRAARAAVALADAELEARRAELEEIRRGRPRSVRAEARAEVTARAAEVDRLSADCAWVTARVAEGVVPEEAVRACNERMAAALTSADEARQRLAVAARPADPAELAASQARVDAAGLAAREARAELERYVLGSPARGALVAPDLEERRGTLVEQGTALFQVSSGRAVLALIEVDPADVNLVRPGARVAVRARVLGDAPAQGTVRSFPTSVERDRGGRSSLIVQAELRTRRPLAAVDLPATAEIEAGRTSFLAATFRRFATWVQLHVLPASPLE